MSSSKIKAFAQVILDHIKLTEVEPDLAIGQLARIVSSGAPQDLSLFLGSPPSAISLDKKVELVKKVVGSGRFDKLVMVLERFGRLGALPDITRELLSICDSESNLVEVEVRSSVELDKDQIQKIVQFVQSSSNLKARIVNVVDSKIKSGFKIFLQDRMIDLSLNGQLDRIEGAFQS